jgi:glycosyltransferase involved in cell wall biosynthesis
MLSFIITCFEKIHLLDLCLKAFTWQDPSIPFEVILVDNNSKNEDPNTIYLKYLPHFPLWLIKQPKLSHTFSVSKARNIGLKIAKYPWIVTLDSDIIINPHYTKRLSLLLQNQRNLILTGERIFIESPSDTDLTKENIKSFKPIKSISNYGLVKDRRMKWLKKINECPHPWSLMHAGNCIYPLQSALHINGYDENFDGCWGYEDIDFAYRLMTQTNCKPLFDEELFCYHLENANLHDQERFDKHKNPNWHRICENIPHFKQYKEAEYHAIGNGINLS